MSHSSSPTNRNSIFGWVKNLKKPNFLSNESVNDLSDSDSVSKDSRIDRDSNGHSLLASHNNGSTASNGNLNASTNNGVASSSQEFLRPILHHKSRSTNNVNRVRSNSQSDKSIRQHRDSFMMNNPLVDENSKYFGVSLDEAIDQASAKISIFANDDHSLQYGKIPIVVAKCGVYLKSKGLTVEGIFRVGGSSKRLKELQLIFNAPPDFGKRLNWDGYTVHDAASILRRYLNALPEPLITLSLYESFRDPLRNRPRIINYMKYKANHPRKSVSSASQPNIQQASSGATSKEIAVPSTPISPHDATVPESQAAEKDNSSLPSPQISPIANTPVSSPTKIHPIEENIGAIDSEAKKSKKSKNYKKLTNDIHEAIAEYKQMLDLLPNLSKQLLFYILDLLAMVQNHSTENLMSSRNLAAIFQPSILSHPSHDLNPTEYALSQFVVEFLIQYAYKLLPNEEHLESKTNSKPNSNSNSSVNLGSQQENQLYSTYKRQHSKSLSSTANHDDFVGYQNNVNSKSLPIVDTDNDFEITDDEQSPSNHSASEVDDAGDHKPAPILDTDTAHDGDVPNHNTPIDVQHAHNNIIHNETAASGVPTNTNVSIIVSTPSSEARAS